MGLLRQQRNGNKNLPAQWDKHGKHILEYRQCKKVQKCSCRKTKVLFWHQIPAGLDMVWIECMYLGMYYVSMQGLTIN